jgi:hypothetical protein
MDQTTSKHITRTVAGESSMFNPLATSGGAINPMRARRMKISKVTTVSEAMVKRLLVGDHWNRAVS